MIKYTYLLIIVIINYYFVRFTAEFHNRMVNSPKKNVYITPRAWFWPIAIGRFKFFILHKIYKNTIILTIFHPAKVIDSKLPHFSKKDKF